MSPGHRETFITRLHRADGLHQRRVVIAPASCSRALALASAAEFHCPPA
jgi:hypothetical protein